MCARASPVGQFEGPRPVLLVFSSHELAALIGAVLIAVLIPNDDRASWLEGVQLLARYAVVPIAFYYTPRVEPVYEELSCYGR